ncbi:plant glycogenin-like starch initiation protein 1 [Perilla frutescens var. frutescens]|nr:plant glycogenin-like starch initiation protein 1 [Perilla frutescens var. frutescens]
MPEISATGNNGTLFNSSVMLIEPSNCTFQLLMDHINEIESYNGGDQGYLNEIFTCSSPLIDCAFMRKREMGVIKLSSFCGGIWSFWVLFRRISWVDREIGVVSSLDFWVKQRMISRKNGGRSSPFLLVLLSFGFFLATYNLLILVMHKTSRSVTEELHDPVISRPDELGGRGGTGAKFHVALTATDAPCSKWQCRIMYYWYKKMKDMLGSDMGGFTKVFA